MVEKRLPLPKVRENQELVAGGDIRLEDNKWLVAALDEAALVRAPREAVVRNLVAYLVHRHNLCLLPSILCCTTLVVKAFCYNASGPADRNIERFIRDQDLRL